MNFFILIFPLVFWIDGVNGGNLYCGQTDCGAEPITQKACKYTAATPPTAACSLEIADECKGVLNRIVTPSSDEICCTNITLNSAAGDNTIPGICEKTKCDNAAATAAAVGLFCKYTVGPSGDITTAATSDREIWTKKGKECYLPSPGKTSTFDKTKKKLPAACETRSGCDNTMTLCEEKCVYTIGPGITSACKPNCVAGKCCLDPSAELLNYDLTGDVFPGCKDKVCSETLHCYESFCGFSKKGDVWEPSCISTCGDSYQCCIAPGKHFLDYNDFSEKPLNCTPVCKKGGNYINKKFCKYVQKTDKSILVTETDAETDCSDSCCLPPSKDLENYDPTENKLPQVCADRVCQKNGDPCFKNSCGFVQKGDVWEPSCINTCDDSYKCCLKPGRDLLDYDNFSEKPSNCTPVCNKGGNYNNKNFCKYVQKADKSILVTMENKCSDSCCLPPSKDLENFDPTLNRLPEICANSVCQKDGDPCYKKCQFSLDGSKKVKASCVETCNELCCLTPDTTLNSAWGSKLPEACLKVCKEGGSNNPKPLCKYTKVNKGIDVSFVETCLNTECCLKPDKKFYKFKASKLPEECQDSLCAKEYPCYGACQFDFQNDTGVTYSCIDKDDQCGTKCCLIPGESLKIDFKNDPKLPTDCKKKCAKDEKNCPKKFCHYEKKGTTVEVECVDKCPKNGKCIPPSEKTAEFDPGPGLLPVAPTPEANITTTSTAFKRVKSNLMIIISVTAALRQ